MKEVHFILLSVEFCRDSVQLFAVDINSNCAASWKKLPMNYASYALLRPDTQYYHLWMEITFWRCYTALPDSQPLSLARVVDIHHPLLIAGNEVAEPFVVAVRSQQFHTRVDPVLQLM